MQPYRSALVQVVPVVGDVAANQRNACYPVGRTRRPLLDEFLTRRDQTRYIVGPGSSQDNHGHDYDRRKQQRGDERRQGPSSAKQNFKTEEQRPGSETKNHSP